MLITVNTQEIQEAFKKLLKVIPTKVISPIFESVKITAQNNSIVITSFGYSSSSSLFASIKIKDFEIHEEGELIIPRETIKMISKFSGLKMTIEDKEIKSEKRTISFVGLIPSDFPVLKNSKYDQKAFTLNTEQFKEILKSTYATSNSEATPVLQGVLIRENLIVATDRYRLSLQKIENNLYEKDLVIHASNLKLINVFLDKKEKTNLTFNVDKNNKYLQVLFNEIEIIIQLIEGTYPDISKIIPKDFNTYFTTNKKILIQELKIMKDMFNIKTKIVTISLTKNILCLSAKFGNNSFTSAIQFKDLKGEDVTLNVNLEYLLQALENNNNEEITFKIGNRVAPFMLDDTALILPIAKN